MSLRHRTTATGVVVVALVLCALDALVYLDLRRELDESTEGAQQILDHTAATLVTGTVVGVLVAALVLHRLSSVALRPLDGVVHAARRIAQGERGVRLGPVSMNTDIGNVSKAFDDVTEALESAIEETRRSDEFNKTFLADAAHQLRTPVSGIQAAVDVLAMGLDPADERQAMTLLRAQSARAADLVNGLLRLAKLDMGEPPRDEFADLQSICASEAERARELAPRLDVEFRSDAAAASPIRLDPASMREALANLLDNARRHAVGKIELVLAVAGSAIEIAVIDDGPGMDRNVSDQAFARFVSLDGCGGTGLGLAIARAIAEAHGGTLGYEDRRFVLRLPLERRRRPRGRDSA